MKVFVKKSTAAVATAVAAAPVPAAAVSNGHGLLTLNATRNDIIGHATIGTALRTLTPLQLLTVFERWEAQFQSGQDTVPRDNANLSRWFELPLARRADYYAARFLQLLEEVQREGRV